MGVNDLRALAIWWLSLLGELMVANQTMLMDQHVGRYKSVSCRALTANLAVTCCELIKDLGFSP